MEKENILFVEEWLETTTDYQLKLLILTSMLAEVNCAYRGTLTDICKWLGIQASSNNNKKINEAIEELQKKGYLIKNDVEGRTFTLTISNKGLRNKKVAEIRRDWIQVFRDYKELENKPFSIDWIKLVRVFVFIYTNDFGNIVKIKDLAKILNMSETTLRNTLKVISSLNLKKIKILSRGVKETFEYDSKYIEGGKVRYTRYVGTQIDIIILFE